MPKIRLSELQAREVPLIYPVEDVGEIRLRYKPYVMTPRFEDELTTYGAKAEGWAVLVSKLVASWDLELEEGVPVALEPEALVAVPGPILKGIVLAINEHASPKAKSAESSGAGSFQAGR